MNFKKLLTLLVLVVACGESNQYSDSQSINHQDFIGSHDISKVILTAPSSALDNDDRLSIYSPEANQAVTFSLKPFKAVAAAPLPIKAEIIRYSSTGYMVAMGKRDLAIRTTQGRLQLNPISLAGDLVALALDHGNGRLVVQDSIGSLAFVKLSEEGEVQGDYLFGSVLSEKGSLTAGGLMLGGQVLFASPGGELTSIDFDASVRQGKKVMQRLAIDAESITWIAGLHYQPDLALLRTDSGLVVFDTSSSTVTDRLAVNHPARLNMFFGRSPHALVRENDLDFTLYHVEESGTLSTKKVRVPGSLQLNRGLQIRSLYDAKDENLSLLTADGAGGFFTRFRVSDSLATAYFALPKASYYGLHQDFIFTLLPSRLGSAQKWRIGPRPSVETTDGFFFR